MFVFVYMPIYENLTSREIDQPEITFKLKYQRWPVVGSWNSGGCAIVYNLNTCEEQSHVISSTQNNMYTEQYHILYPCVVTV